MLQAMNSKAGNNKKLYSSPTLQKKVGVEISKRMYLCALKIMP
jgi:hypothetical protein